MDLNDNPSFTTLDTHNYLGEIDNLPAQLQNAYQTGLSLSVPPWQGIQKVLIAGMGGSAIGGDLLIAYTAPFCPLPMVVQRNYTLPAWAHGPETLVIASSHSGNTEETLTAFDQAQENNCHILALCTGGKLAEKARAANIPLWTFEHAGQPRAAVGFSFGLLLALLTKLGFIPEQGAELAKALSAMRKQQEALTPQVPVAQNMAKRLALQLAEHWVMIFGADVLEPVARRWKTQVNELAKTWAQYEVLPEADHNSLAGLQQPKGNLPSAVALFLRGSSNHARNQLRVELTQNAYQHEGVSTALVEAQGDSALAQQWTALHLGDYTAYYLAMLYEIDPTPIPALVEFKKQLAER
jgi:glucose/mannose-6-phosphate isomerase